MQRKAAAIHIVTDGCGFSGFRFSSAKITKFLYFSLANHIFFSLPFSCLRRINIRIAIGPGRCIHNENCHILAFPLQFFYHLQTAVKRLFGIRRKFSPRIGLKGCGMRCVFRRMNGSISGCQKRILFFVFFHPGHLDFYQFFNHLFPCRRRLPQQPIICRCWVLLAFSSVSW